MCWQFIVIELATGVPTHIIGTGREHDKQQVDNVCLYCQNPRLHIIPGCFSIITLDCVLSCAVYSSLTCCYINADMLLEHAKIQIYYWCI